MCLLHLSVITGAAIILLNMKIQSIGINFPPALGTILKHSYDVVLWASVHRGISIKNKLFATETVITNPKPTILNTGENPSINIFITDNFTVLQSYILLVSQLLEKSQNLSDFSSIYLKTTQSCFLFLLPQNENLHTLEYHLLRSNLTSFSLNSQMYALVGPNDLISMSRNNTFHLYEFYYLKNTLKLEFVIAGIWDNIYVSIMEPVSLRRRNFELTDVIALGYCSDDYPEECKWNNDTQSFESGAAVDVFRDLQKSFNFSEVAINGYGYIETSEINLTILEEKNSLENMTTPAWLLLQGKVDVAIASNVHTTKLPVFFSLPHPTFQFGLIAFFQQPLHNSKSIFISPFRPNAWGAFFYFWLITGVICGSFIIVERLYLNEITVDLVEVSFEIFSDLAYSTAACVCQRGLAALSLLFRLRYIFTAALFASILWNAAYQAGYVSTLSVHERPIRSFQHLLEAQYQFVVNNESVSIPHYILKLLETKNISKSRLEYIKTNCEAFDWLNKRNFAYLEYFDTFHGLLRTHQRFRFTNPDDYFCKDVSAVLVDKRLLTSGFVLPKHSPYREHFNIKIIQLKEVGLSFKYLKTYERSTQPRCLPHQSFWSDLDLKDVDFAFKILIHAAILSSALLIVEILVKRVVAGKKNLQLVKNASAYSEPQTKT